MVKAWKSKKSDFYLALIYFIIYCSVIHILSSIKYSIKNNQSIFDSITSSQNYLFTLLILFFCMSPVVIYFKKVPKLLKIDSDLKRLEIHKRKRILGYDINRIRYYTRVTKFFYILEIHATFTTSRNQEIERLATSIIVPNWGLSWNKKEMEEIVKTFDELSIPKIKNRPLLPLHEYFYN